MRRFLAASLMFVLVPALASGMATGIPDPDQCTVPTVVFDPDGTVPYVVQVRDTDGDPIAGASVEISVPAAVDAMICWCSGQVHPVISATTDANGVATFTIIAGGCIDPDSLGGPAIEVYASGVKLAEVGAVSPDAVDAFGLFPWQGWNPGGVCATGLSDAVLHNASIKIRKYSYCTDLDSDGRITLIDAVLVTKPIRLSYTCP